MAIERETLETEAEVLLWEAIREGRNCDLRAIDGRSNKVSLADAWSPQRNVRAALIQQVLEGGSSPNPRPRKLHLVGARITGSIDLEAVTLSCPLWLERCIVEEALILEQTQAAFVDLTGSRLHGLRAHQLSTGTSLYLFNVPPTRR